MLFQYVEKKVKVEFIPMDLLNNVEEITMMNLFFLYNINPVPLAICAPPPHLKT